MGQDATITDVARMAQVSIKTVSRVLNHEPNVTEAVRERVGEAVRALDYSPRLSARRLAGSRSFMIGFLFDSPSQAYVAGMELGAIERCAQDHYHLIVEPVDMAAPDQRMIEGALARLRPDGLILTPPVCDNPLVLDAAERVGVRCVAIAPDRAPDSGPSVQIDDAGAARDMTRYLLQLGHERIGFIKGHPDHRAAQRRLDGFLSALREAGLQPDWSHIRQGMFSFASGVECGAELLALPEPPTAIFAANDDMALGVMAAAEQAGLSVPRDVSVAGFDDSPAAKLAWPPLTTMRQPLEQMARQAADMLILMAAKRTPESTTIVADCELIVRESCAPPSA